MSAAELIELALECAELSSECAERGDVEMQGDAIEASLRLMSARNILTEAQS